jgi:hypothetical protein
MAVLNIKDAFSGIIGAWGHAPRRASHHREIDARECSALLHRMDE